MKKIVTILSFISIVLFYQCNKTTYLLPGFTEENFTNMRACRNNAIIDSADIAQNLVGEWKSVGYTCRLCETAPNITLQLSEGTGILDFKDARDGNIFLEFEWTLEKTSVPDRPYVIYHLKTESTHFSLELNLFCEQNMFFISSNPVDHTSRVLYEKQ